MKITKKSTVFFVLTCCLIMVFSLVACNPKTSDNGDGSDEDNTTVATTLTHVKELADNVDSVPTLKSTMALQNSRTSTTASTASGISSVSSLTSWREYETEVRDLTTPNENYLNYCAYDSYFNSLWSSVDGNLKSFLDCKDEVLEKVRQLNVWVDYVSGIEKCRVNYDRLTDVVNIETLQVNDSTFADGAECHSVNYRTIYSSYDSMGRIVVKAKSEYVNNSQLVSEFFIDYVEGVSWTCTRLENAMNKGSGKVYKSILYSDLSQKGRNIIELSQEEAWANDTLEWRSLSGKIMNQYNNMPVVITVSHYDRSAMLPDYGVYFYTDKGYNIATLMHNDNGSDPRNYSSLRLALYQMSGWDKYLLHCAPDDKMNGTVELVIGDDTYFADSTDESDIVSQYFTWKANSMTCGVDIEPGIWLYPNDRDADEQLYSSQLDGFLNGYGLSLKNNISDMLSKYLGEYMTICQDTEVFGIKDLTSVTAEDFATAYEENTLIEFDISKLLAMEKEPKISVADQKEENEIFEMLNLDISGCVSLDVIAKQIDLTQLGAQVKTSILLEEEAEYSLNIALCAQFKTIVVASLKVVFDGKDLVFTFAESITINADDLELDNDYQLMAFFAKEVDSSPLRLSKYYKIVGNSNSNFEIVITKTETVDEETQIEHKYGIAVSASTNEVKVGYTEIIAPSEE